MTRLQILLGHSADTRRRSASGQGPIELAVEGERWNAVLLLAQRIPDAKDIVIGRNVNIGHDGETLRARLSREAQSLKDSNQPVPEAIRAALAFVDAH